MNDIQKPVPGELIDAVIYNDIERVKALLQRGADINENIAGTPLIWGALSSRRKEIMLLLIEKGAEVNERNAAGLTALSYVVLDNYVDVARALIEHGADMDVKNRIGLTPLMSAVMNEEDEMVRLLLEKGARVDEKTFSGSTALMLSINHNKIEVIRLLLEHGANPYEKNEDGKTILELAQGFPEAKKLMQEAIEQRADVIAAEIEKERARHSAVVSRQRQLQKQAARGPRLRMTR